MATKIQRVKSIIEAIRNEATTNPETNRIMDAFVAQYSPEAQTQEERATAFLRALRQFVRGTVSSHEIRAAQQAATNTHIPPEIGAD